MVKETYPNSALLDSMTIQGALRLLSTEPGMIPTYSRSDAERFRAHKWDYELNSSFRIATDVACLAQLVQALSIHERVYVKGDFAQYLTGAQLERAKDLARYVTVLDLDQDTHLQHFASASRETFTHFASGNLRAYLGLLSTTSTEAPFLHISHGYFETGYSDFSLFLGRDFPPVPKDPGDASQNWVDIQAYIALMRELDYENNLLLATPQDGAHAHDKAVAARDVLRHVHAVFYYQSLAADNGAVYLPHPLRSSLAAFDVLQAGLGAALADYIVKIAASSRKAATEPLNRLFSTELVNCDIPFFLAMVLRESKTPQEVLPRVFDVRYTAAAARWRSWLRRIDEESASGTLTIETLRRELRTERYGSSDEASFKTGESGTTTVGLTLGIVSIQTDVANAGIRGRLSRPRHLRILQSLADISNATPRFDALIGRVLGDQVGRAWLRYQHTIKEFERLDLSEQERSYSPLHLVMDLSRLAELATSPSEWDQLSLTAATTEFTSAYILRRYFRDLKPDDFDVERFWMDMAGLASNPQSEGIARRVLKTVGFSSAKIDDFVERVKEMMSEVTPP